MFTRDFVKNVTLTTRDDGMTDVVIDFTTDADGKFFAKLVRERYGRKRYSAKLGGQFLAELLRGMCDRAKKAESDAKLAKIEISD